MRGVDQRISEGTVEREHAEHGAGGGDEAADGVGRGGRRCSGENDLALGRTRRVRGGRGRVGVDDGRAVRASDAVRCPGTERVPMPVHRWQVVSTERRQRHHDKADETDDHHCQEHDPRSSPRGCSSRCTSNERQPLRPGSVCASAEICRDDGRPQSMTVSSGRPKPTVGVGLTRVSIPLGGHRRAGSAMDGAGAQPLRPITFGKTWQQSSRPSID